MIKLIFMWSKIYLAALALSILVLGFLDYYAYSWLQSIGDPMIAAAKYVFNLERAWTFLWVSSAILLILANVVLWRTRRPWALWATFIYFAADVILKAFWLQRTFAAFLISNNFEDAVFWGGPFIAVILCAIFAGIVFFDQFLVLRLAEKMYPPPVAEPAVPESDEAPEV